MKKTLSNLLVATLSFTVQVLQCRADLVGLQKPALPEITASPESGQRVLQKDFVGQERWKRNFQRPATVPVNFDAAFSGVTELTVTLGDKSVSGEPDETNTGQTDTGQVRLRPYQTYTLSISGEMIVSAEVTLAAVDLYDLVSGRNTTGNPGRAYAVFMYDPGSNVWVKVCSSHKPSWSDPLGESSLVAATFLIQVRPDLGVRPAVYTSGDASAEDQADDAWTRDEPPIDSATVAGDGQPLAIAGGAGPDASAINFTWAGALGRMWNGGSAGQLRILGSRLDTNAFGLACLNYAARSADTNEVCVLNDLDETNSPAQIKTPHALVSADLLYGSALAGDTNLFSVTNFVASLSATNADLLSHFLWTNFTTLAQQTLTNATSTVSQVTTTLVAQLNGVMQGGAIYDTNRFAGVALSGRTRRLLLVNPQGSALVRLDRFLLEDAYPTNISRLRAVGFDLNFFATGLVGPRDALGYFTVASNATAFVDWRVDSPDGSTNNWRLQEFRNGGTNTTLLSFNPTNTTWTLTRGSGTDSCIETRAVTVAINAGVTNRTEAQELKNGAGVVCERNVEVFQGFDWGYELVGVTNDPGGANLVTQFTYDTTFQQPASITYPDGYWETRQYSTGGVDEYLPYGALERVVHPWKDTPSGTGVNDCTVTDYGSPGSSAGPGSFTLQVWHNATGFGEDTDFSEKLASEVHGELSWVDADDCGDSTTFVESRDVGSIWGEGELSVTETYAPSAGRIGGQLRYKNGLKSSYYSYDYEFGQWVSTNLSFTVDSGATTNLDMRQSIYFGGDAANLWPYVGDALLEHGDSGNDIKDVVLFSGRSTKEVRIIQNGNLVAKMFYVFGTNFCLTSQTIYQRDCLGHATNVFRIDPGTGQIRTVYKADWTGSGTWPSDLKLSESDENGVVSSYTYDSLKRTKTKTKAGASVSGYPAQGAITNLFACDAVGHVLTNTTVAGTLTLKTVAQYDLAGRVTNQISPEGLATSFAYANGGRQTTATYSSGATKVTRNYLDRRVASVTGSAVTNTFLDYGQTGRFLSGSNFRLIPKNVTTNTYGATNALRWTAVATDPRYEPVDELRPGFRSSAVLEKRTDFVGAPAPFPGGLSESSIDGSMTTAGGRLDSFYNYDYLGAKNREVHEGPDLAARTDAPLDSLCRITGFTNYYELNAGCWFNVSEQWSYPVDNDATRVLVQRTRQRLTGFSSAGVAETQTIDADTNQTTVTVTVDLANKKLTTVTSIAQSSLSATQVVVNGLLQTESTPTVATPSTHYFDSLGREIGVVDPLGNQTGTRYDSSTGQATATTNAQGFVTTMEYYPPGGTNAGLLKCQTGPTGKKTYYNYNGWGRVIQTWGDVPYPEQRTYNQFGDLATLTTYRGGTGWSGASWPASPGTGDVTSWYYDEPTGLLTNKMDAASHSVTFDYYVNQFPKTRVWARGAASTNLYSANGDLTRIDYSDGTSVVFTDEDFQTLNRLGKPSVVIDGSGTNVLTYDYAERLVSSACVGGLLAGITVTNHFNPLYGRDLLKVIGPSWAFTNGYGYDAYGRMSVVSNGIYSATYAYLANSDLLQTTTSKSNTTTVLTATRIWEAGPRLRSIVNTVNGAVVTSHEYQYDALDRRKGALLEDGSRWQYDYNDRNELTGGRRYWSDWSPVAGQQFGYDYDNIGNRKDARSGGDTNGWNLRETDYTANNLNHYSAVATPGYDSILGVAFATNSVTVNSGTADRKGEYFHNEITIANGSGPLWQSVAVTSGGTTTNGGLVFPGSSQTLTNDADGNLTFDGIWAYDWDCENRLAGMTMTNSITSLANSNRLRLEFVYDQHGRRVGKTVKTWNGTGFTNAAATQFAYDDWNIVAELSATDTLVRTYLWGEDVAGVDGAAGGIGGLVAVQDWVTLNSQASTHFLAYDCNGNVTAMQNASDKSNSARYEYSPCGETLRATGLMASANSFRFSTKPMDNESGLANYGHRYYDCALGRWISRDALEEDGGLNLYAYVANKFLNAHDALGMETAIDVESASAEGAGMDAEAGSSIAKTANRVKEIINTVQDIDDIFSAVLAMDDPINAALQVKELSFELLSTKNKKGRGSDPYHHLIPQKLRKALGNEVDKFTVALAKRLHRRLHMGDGFGRGGIWNGLWNKFMKNKNGKPTEAEIKAFTDQIARLFGLDGLNPVPYR
jgi:RHS repeat-associated protein